MSLTQQERDELHEVLARTGGPRESMLQARVIPEDYLAYMGMVDREELVFEEKGIVPVRVIITKAKDCGKGCPVHVNMHGGGFILPQNIDDDRYCAHVAAGIRGIVVDIDYAKSDEHPFPAAFDQCYAVVRWVFAHAAMWGGDVRRVSLGGHSAGGNLVEAIAIKSTRTKDFKVCLQVLDYAATDNSLALLPDGLERSRAFSLFYVDGEVQLLKDPFVSPAYAPDELFEGQPDALVISAGLCPFVSVNGTYALRLAGKGVKVTIKGYPQSHHGFTVRLLDAWREAQGTIIEAIKAASL